MALSGAEKQAAYRARLRTKLGDEAYLAKRRADKKAAHAVHPEVSRKQRQAWRAANPEKVAAENIRRNEAYKNGVYATTTAAWRAANPEKVAAYRKSAGPAVYKHRASKIANNAERKARKLKATPNWADRDLMTSLYKLAAIYTKVTGTEYHVDHIVPLRGETVCGLHVHNNLQILEGQENRLKGNSFNAC